jgi:hypothetical protein
MGDEVVNGARAQTDGSTRVSFSDLVRAHYAWDKRAHDAPAPGSKETDSQRSQEQDSGARGTFDDKLRRFENDAGRITEAYWCRKGASAVALTKKRVSVPGRLGGLGARSSDEYHLFRVTDWVTSDTGEIPNVLHECDVLAIKAATGLEGLPQAVVMQWLQAVESHVLGFIERHGDLAPTRAEMRSFIARQRAELTRIEDYYQRAGEKRARMHYVSGMLVGVPILAVLAGLLVALLVPFGAPGLETDAMRAFYVALAGGGIGAVVSVLMRMSRGEGFTIDHELGSRGVFRLGIYRPLIGAVSAVAVYFLVQTPLLSIDNDTRSFQYYAILGFLAGFSERWTRVTLSGAMRTVDGDGSSERSSANRAANGDPPFRQ